MIPPLADFEVNVQNSAPDDLVISGCSVNLVPSGSECGPVLSESKMTDINHGRSEVLGRELRRKLPS